MSETGFDHRSLLKSVGNDPGIYQMLDAEGDVLYVGKARQLRKRLASYFRASGIAPKTRALVQRIASIQVTVTNTEAEALLLEQNLIKRHRPTFNILMRDDKSYPYIFVSDHEYPRLALHRGARRRKGRYFGPYPNAGAVRESLNFLQKVFRVRQCEDSFYNNRSRPCLQHQIGRCTAPCVGAIEPDEYAEDLRHTLMFLEGKSNDLVTELADCMEQASAKLDFEQAAACRDQIQQLQAVQARQYVEGAGGELDVVAATLSAGLACVHILFVRDGRILGSRSWFPKLRLEEGESEVLSAFLSQRYLGSSREDMPREILINIDLPEAEAMSEAIASVAGRRVPVRHRLRGGRARWMQLAESTAEQNLNAHLADRQTRHQRLLALREALDLPELPQRLECFDISHSGGEATTASCVVFEGGGPLKSDYRKFNIEGVAAGDDYAAMGQALSRRYRRLRAGEGKLPDVLFIDGGKGQVSQARKVLEELQVPEVTIVGVGKGADRRAGLETLVLAASGRELVLPPDSAALHLIQHIRDESHRFAITGHKARRDKSRRQSTLEGIAGVGPRRRRELLRHFGGLQGIRQASVEDLARVPGISMALARDIHAVLRERG